MLLSKLKRLNPTQITHPFSKSRLGFCNISNITQQQQKQDDEETIKQITSIFSNQNWEQLTSVIKPLNPNLVQTSILQTPTCHPRILSHFFIQVSALKKQNIMSYLLVSKRWVESNKLTCDPVDLSWAQRTLRNMAKSRVPISDVLDAMTSLGLCSQMFTQMIFAYKNSRIHEDAVYMYDEAVYLLLNYKNGDCFPDSKCLNLLMKDLLKYNEMDLFWKVYERMIEFNVTFNIYLYRNLIDGYFKVGKMEDAKRVFLEMKEKDCSPDLVIYNLIIGWFLKEGEVDEALKLKNEMVAAGIEVDKVTFISIIKGLCKLGEYKEAIRIVGGMKDDGVLPDFSCYHPIILDLRKGKRTEELWDLIAQMVENKVKPKDLTYGVLRSTFTTKKNVMMYFKRLIAHGIIPDQDIFATLFEGCYGRRNTRGVFSVMINVIDDSIVRDDLHIYNVLIQRFSKYKKMDYAMELLSEIHKKGLVPDCCTYSYLIFGFIDKGDEEKARLLFNEMQQRNVCPNDVTFSEMLQTQLPGRRNILLKRWLQLMKKKKRGVTLV